MRDFSSRQLRAFLLVAHYGSFARAAGRMFITPSGLSIIIRELESQIGTRLFDRTTRHVALTAAGSELLRVVQPALRDIDDAIGRVSDTSGSDAASLTVGAVPLVAASVLPLAIREFRARRSGLGIHVVDRDAATLVQHIESGTLDLGLGVFFAHLRGIHRTSLFRFSFLMIRAVSRAAPRRTTTWASLKRETLISLDPRYPLQQMIDKYLTRAGVRQHPAFALSSLNTVIAMVEAGLGIGIIPSFWLAACVGRAVVATQLTAPIVRLDFQMIQPSGRKFPPLADAFVSFLHGRIVDWATEMRATR